jgi:hypothetical protein
VLCASNRAESTVRHPSTKADMEHWGPLIQTVLWVGLVGTALWFYHQPLYGLLTAIQRRIEAGSSIKAGPFEISEQLKPQDASKQREKVESELAEALQEPYAAVAEGTALSQQKAGIQARYFQAEDLALRAIQAEFGATISRQVTAGADIGFDGAFVINGRYNIVEVKFVRRSISQSKIKADLDRLVGAISRYGWRNVQIILAFVFENPADIADAERVQRIVQQSSVPTVVRTYSLAQLQAQFGVGPADGD